MIEIKTESGFSCTLKKTALDNMELVDAMTEESVNEGFRVSKVATLLLGSEKKRLYDHVRREDGTVPIGAVSKEIQDIIMAFNQDGKNS